MNILTGHSSNSCKKNKSAKLGLFLLFSLSFHFCKNSHLHFILVLILKLPFWRILVYIAYIKEPVIKIILVLLCLFYFSQSKVREEATKKMSKKKGKLWKKRRDKGKAAKAKAEPCELQTVQEVAGPQETSSLPESKSTQDSRPAQDGNQVS